MSFITTCLWHNYADAYQNSSFLQSEKQQKPIKEAEYVKEVRGRRLQTTQEKILTDTEENFLKDAEDGF